jgi:uncharacterized protein
MISAYPPSRYPPDLVAFANTRRGRHKILYASDYPLLKFDRVRRELPTCGISEEVMPLFTGKNAERIFWREGDAAEAEV